MEQSKLDRINALARLAKERPLSEEELAERDRLRKEYIAEWRASTIATLESIRIQNPDGSIQALRKKETS